MINNQPKRHRLCDPVVRIASTTRVYRHILPAAVGLCLLAVCSLASAQTVVDKTVATVSNGALANPDLITYSDLVWQLALQPGWILTDHPASQDLNRALRTREDQLLIFQEARKLPTSDSAVAQAEFEADVKKKRDELAQVFGGSAQLQERMARVGLSADQLNEILRERVTIDKYIDFRFKAFVLITRKEIADRYDRDYAPLRNSGKIMPSLEQVRAHIEEQLREEKSAEEIDKFIDNLREQPGTEIMVLSPV